MSVIKTTKYSQANLSVSFLNQQGKTTEVKFNNGIAEVENDFAEFLCKTYKFLQPFDNSQESSKSESFDFASINIDELDPAQIKAILSDTKFSTTDIQDICKGRGYPNHEWAHKKRNQLVSYFVEKIQQERQEKVQ